MNLWKSTRSRCAPAKYQNPGCVPSHRVTSVLTSVPNCCPGAHSSRDCCGASPAVERQLPRGNAFEADPACSRKLVRLSLHSPATPQALRAHEQKWTPGAPAAGATGESLRCSARWRRRVLKEYLYTSCESFSYLDSLPLNIFCSSPRYSGPLPPERLHPTAMQAKAGGGAHSAACTCFRRARPAWRVSRPAR